MKKLLIASTVAATFFAPQAFAQAQNFEGPSLTASVNFATGTTEVASNTFNGTSTESSQNLALQAQYNFALGNQFVLGLGLTLGVGDLKAGTWVMSGVNVVSKQKESSSVYIAPGFAATPSLLVYGKLAALQSKVEASSPTASVSATFSGVGYGAGVQSYFSKNIYAQVELMQNNYADRYFTLNNETDKGKSTALTIGVGYKF